MAVEAAHADTPWGRMRDHSEAVTFLARLVAEQGAKGKVYWPHEKMAALLKAFTAMTGPIAACDEEEEEVLCNWCGETCRVVERGHPSGSVPHGLVRAQVTGGYLSTPGSGPGGALDDTTGYEFSLCEFCLDHMFSRFKTPPKLFNYMHPEETPEPFRPAEQRVREDEWRKTPELFLAEKERRDLLRRGMGMRPIHPGEILREEFLLPMGLTLDELARALEVPAVSVQGVLAEREPVTQELAQKLAQRFGTTVGFWENLQRSYELARSRAQV
jgi:antitoxin HigA-1